MKFGPRAVFTVTMITALALGLAAPITTVQAARVTVRINGGPLGLGLSGPAELAEVDVTGADQRTGGTLGLIDIRDARGTGAGWNLVAEATDFINRENDSYLIDGAGFYAGAPAPVTTVAGGAAPLSFSGSLGSPVKLLSAAAGGGMGHYQTQPPVTLDIPADVFAGTYDSTLTLTLSSGP